MFLFQCMVPYIMRVSDIVYLSPIKLNTWQTNRTIASLSVLYYFLLRKQCSIHWSQLRFALQWANASFNWNWMAFSGKRFFTSLLGPATQNTHKCNNFRDRAQNNNRLHPTPAYNSPLLLSLSVSHLYRLNGARLNVQNPLSGSTETDVEIQRREKKKKFFSSRQCSRNVEAHSSSHNPDHTRNSSREWLISPRHFPSLSSLSPHNMWANLRRPKCFPVHNLKINFFHIGTVKIDLKLFCMYPLVLYIL